MTQAWVGDTVLDPPCVGRAAQASRLKSTSLLLARVRLHKQAAEAPPRPPGQVRSGRAARQTSESRKACVKSAVWWFGVPI